MIDIHSHILQGVDDGSEDIAMSIDMAKMYLDNGIKTVIATPHYIEGSMGTSIGINKIAYENLKRELRNIGLELDIYLGNEIFISMNLINDLEKEKVSTLNGTKYVLIELPMFDIPLYVENMIFELLLKGYIPILAHPERNMKIMEDPNILYKYILKGALTQLNLPSLEGRYGSKVLMTAKILLKHQMIHFVGTDAHSNKGRSPRIKSAFNKLRSIVSEEDLHKITSENAKLLLKNENINIKMPIKYKMKWWRKFSINRLN